MKRALTANGILKIVASAALALALAACATATPYQPLNPRDISAGGYTDIKLDSTHWRVSFAGNTVTSRETVERYLLYRAAELTVSQGFDWFEEVRQHTNKQTEYYVDPYDPFYEDFGYGYGWRPYWSFHRFGPYGGWASWGPGWGYDPWGPSFVDTFDRYDATAEIMMGRGPKPPQALNAREVVMNLGPGIVRPEAAKR